MRVARPHDIFAMKDYLPCVKDIRATHKHEDLELTHKPVHPDSLGSWALANIHGHEVMLGDAPDPRYFNACREDEVLAPVEIGDARVQAAARA